MEDSRLISPTEVSKMKNYDILRNIEILLHEYHYGRNNQIESNFMAWIHSEVENIGRLKEKADRLMRRSEVRDIVDEMYNQNIDRVEEE